ncbi:hypothetical protein D3C80_766940 [compost metagenome]
MTRMASTSCVMRMEPISAAKDEAERPASNTAVMTTANSRNTATPISCTAKTPAPNWVSKSTPMKATTAPMKKLVTTTIGMASRPVRSAWLNQAGQRMRPGCFKAVTTAAISRPRKASDSMASAPKS